MLPSARPHQQPLQQLEWANLSRVHISRVDARKPSGYLKLTTATGQQTFFGKATASSLGTTI
jgi:hypothetical protein